MTTFWGSQQPANTSASIPEVLSLPSSTLMISMDKLNENSEQERNGCSSELQSVSSYNSLSSLSSCGSELCKGRQNNVCGEGSTTSRPRSIFKTYWDNSGDRPSMIRADKSTATPATASVSSWDSDEESAANSYERILKRNEGVKTRRRSIFSQYQSTPSLARPYHPAPLERRAKSAPELEKKTLPSCLRRSTNLNRACSSSSVSFDCEVSVITFTSPQENWAAEGWSKIFH